MKENMELKNYIQIMSERFQTITKRMKECVFFYFFVYLFSKIGLEYVYKSYESIMVEKVSV